MYAVEFLKVLFVSIPKIFIRLEQIGRSSILQPKINYKGGSIKWYEDKLKPEQPEPAEK